MTCELLVIVSLPGGRGPVLCAVVVVLLSELRLVSSQLAVVLSRSVGGQAEKVTSVISNLKSHLLPQSSPSMTISFQSLESPSLVNITPEDNCLTFIHCIRFNTYIST